MERHKKSGVLRKAVFGLAWIGLAAASGGCLAAAAVGAGGAVGWQAGKVVSEEGVPRDRAVDAVLATFKAKQIRLTEKVIKTRATQIRGEFPDGANVYVDVLPVNPKSCRIEIRVGIGQKGPARELLNGIKDRL